MYFPLLNKLSSVERNRWEITLVNVFDQWWVTYGTTTIRLHEWSIFTALYYICYGTRQQMTEKKGYINLYRGADSLNVSQRIVSLYTY